MEDSRLATARKWLEDMFGRAGKPVPPFELTPRAVDVIHALAMKNRANNADAQTSSAMLERLADEYRREAARYEELLSPLGLLPEHHPPGFGRKRGVLGREPPKRVVRQELKREIRMTDTQLQDARAFLDTTQRALEQLQEESIAHQNGDENMAAMKARLGKLTEKRRAYVEAVAKSKVERIAVLPTAELTHESLVAKAEAVDKLAAEASRVRQDLQAFADLPPDVARAEALLEEAREEVTRLTKEFEEAAHADNAAPGAAGAPLL